MKSVPFSDHQTMIISSWWIIWCGNTFFLNNQSSLEVENSLKKIVCIFQTLAPFGGLLCPWGSVTHPHLWGGVMRQIQMHLEELNETHLGRTGCQPSPPRRYTAMPSYMCHASSQGRARTGRSSLLATLVCTSKRRKMEQVWAINIPPTESCGPALIPIMSARFFSFSLFRKRLIH